MKYLVPTLFAVSSLAVLSVGTANAASAPLVTYTQTTCTSLSAGGEAPMGTYVGPNGRHWAGFKATGMPPDSLVSGGSESPVCNTITYQAEEPS